MQIVVIHHVPVGDAIDHELDELCVCGPTPSGNNLMWGRLNWIFTHHRLGGPNIGSTFRVT